MIKILFDNATKDSLWGFSLYIEEYKLLFDTGSNGRVLLNNMEKLGVKAEEISYLFVSHSHWDHIGGIDSLLELNPDITMFVPSSLSKYLIKDLKSLTKKVEVIDEKPKKLFKNLYTTGILGREMPEHSLIIDDIYPKVITGCGHYGIDKIVNKAKKIVQKDIKMAIGGFHLLSKNDDEVKNISLKLKDIGVEKVVPTHCTGKKAFKIFKKVYKENCLQGGIGSSFELFSKK